MIRGMFGVGLLTVAACAHHGSVSPSNGASQPPLQPEFAVEVARDGDLWQITYRFREPQTALLFDTNHKDYRVNHWRAPDGVTLKNLSGLDGMFFDRPRTSVQFLVSQPKELTPGTLAFIPFSDGGVALYSGQLALLTVASQEAAAALNGDLSKWHGRQPAVEVRLVTRTAAPPHPPVIAQFGRGPYLYVGEQEPKNGLLIDEQIPGWVEEELVVRFPKLVEGYESHFKKKVPPAQVLLGWGGDEGAFLNRGRAEGDQISMVISGERYKEKNPQATNDLVWFFAHELEHHYQLERGAGGPKWMAEGFADTLATRSLAELSAYSHKDLVRKYERVIWACSQQLGSRPLSQTRSKAAYSCGDLAGLALLSVLPEHNLATAWQAAALSEGGEVTNTALWAALSAAGAPKEGLSAVEAFVTGSHPDPTAAITDLITKTGLTATGSTALTVFPYEAGPK